jgi:hypothetical protein
MGQVGECYSPLRDRRLTGALLSLADQEVCHGYEIILLTVSEGVGQGYSRPAIGHAGPMFDGRGCRSVGCNCTTSLSECGTEPLREVVTAWWAVLGT